MLDNIYLRFKHDWPGFWVRLSVSAALCDGPVNESEQKALLQFCNRICDLYGVDDAARLWNAFANSPEDPEHLKNRKPQQEAKVLLIVLREIYRLLYADGVSNEKEFTWVDRFSMATGLDSELAGHLGSLYFGREEAIKQAEQTLDVPAGVDLSIVTQSYRRMVKEYHPDKLHSASDGVRTLATEKLKLINEAYDLLNAVKSISDKLAEFSVYVGDGWKLLNTMSANEVVICANCTQKNRLPEKHRFVVARCGVCHGYLAWTVEQDQFFQRLLA